MIDRENLGVTDVGQHPIISVPDAVKGYFWSMANRVPDIEARQVGRGFHRGGSRWGYIEVEIRAASVGRAHEEAERLLGETMLEFQLK